MSADVNAPANGYQEVINATVAYNTIVNCNKGIMISAENHGVPPDDCTFANNIVSITNAPPVVHNDTPTNSTYAGNYFYRSDGSVSVPSSGYQDVDPELEVAVGDSIYRPSTSSPVVAAALTGYSGEGQDFEAQPRPAVPTVGADEPSTAPTIDRGIYGPTWLHIPEETAASYLLEAEEGLLGSQWTMVSDPLACGLSYMLPPNASSLNDPPTTASDMISFSVSLDSSGTYKIYARTLTTGVDDDSFWVRANNGAWQKWNAINAPDYLGLYEWSQVGNWTGGTTADPVTFQLQAGTNTIYFAWREADARLDKIFVTRGDLTDLNVVQSNSADEPTSLQYFVEEACPQDTIYFDVGTDGVPIEMDANVMNIGMPLTIIGNGPTATVLDGGHLHPILVNNSSQLTLSNMTLANGYAPANGGALLNTNALYLFNIIFQNNFEGTTRKAFSNTGLVHIVEEGEVSVLD